MHRPLLILLASVFLFAGCATPIKQGWYDFTAYYNTFYNAKQFYNEGVQLNERQVPEINPAAPIRVHQSPTQAGQAEFEEAIEKGASILRNHEKSNFVNSALFLIGRSYYYRSEFFSALEKFQEMERISSGEELQQAILWQGRTLLELRNIDEGIRLLESEIEYIEDWSPALLAEVRTVLAQLYTVEQNWARASENLLLATDNLQSRKLKARAYFLHGQVLERLGFDNQALAAYRFASEIRVEYDIEFNSRRKKAELNRKLGNYDSAVTFYRNLERDDKFLEYHVEMRYEIARTYQKKNDTDQAIQLYRNILNNRFEIPDNTTRALTYFGLGEIYRDDIGNFTMAAAYFDSATTVRIDNSRLSERFNAAELATSFGEYASIKRELSRTDSLLYLANLEPEKLDSVVAIVQQRMIDEAEREEGESQRRTGRLMARTVEETVTEATEIQEHGFLNIRNQVLLADGSRQFQAIWGDRPLGDNWRRRADISGSRFDQIVLGRENDEGTGIFQNEEGLVVAGPDLSQIPLTEEEQREMEITRERLQYNLANLFMFSLEMPDSAKIYYKKVIGGGLDRELIPPSVYSLIDLELTGGNRDEAERWIDILLTDFPESVYSELIAERFDRPFMRAGLEDRQSTEEKFMAILHQSFDGGSAEKAQKLQKLAMETEREDQKPLILYESAREYLKAAVQRAENRQALTEWLQQQHSRNLQQQELTAKKDSARTMLENSEQLTEEEISYWQSFADSTIEAGAATLAFPFEGAYWDSTRSVLSYIEANYSSSPVISSVQSLNKSIEKPESTAGAEELISERFPDRLMPRDPAPTSRNCLDMGLKFGFEGGMEAFVEKVNFPDWTQDVNMRGEISYRIVVDNSGRVESFEQISRMDRSGIPQSFESAIESELRFEPHTAESSITCELTFPIEI